MGRYTDAEKLYERFAELEAQALDHIENLNKIPLEEMTKEEYVEWRVWSAILRERSAFKFDVADAPTADVVEVVRCKDCKYGCEKPNNMIYCPQFAGGSVSENSFCSMWERK